MSFSEFSEMRLAGGTALALQIGHRISVDLDFFGEIDFDDVDFAKCFRDFDGVTTLKKSSNIQIFEINGVKVDFVNYSYPWLNDYIIHDNIRLATIDDIAAMKIAAITGRGTRKDFVDLYFLLKKQSLKQILELFERKYYDASTMLALKSLSYFDDAEKDFPCNMLIPVEWSEVKKEIQNHLENHVNLL